MLYHVLHWLDAAVFRHRWPWLCAYVRHHSAYHSQAWFWDLEWQAGEAEVTRELAAGHGEVFENVEDFLADLDR